MPASDAEPAKEGRGCGDARVVSEAKDELGRKGSRELEEEAGRTA